MQNVLCSSAIEEEFLNAESVRSSLAKCLDLPTNAPVSDIEFIACNHTQKGHAELVQLCILGRYF